MKTYKIRVSSECKFMVWCSNQYGDELDTFDYEIYIWNVNSLDVNTAVRLTFHSANDCWPDIFTGISVKKGPDIRNTELPVTGSARLKVDSLSGR